jgi:hypothetical protein
VTLVWSDDTHAVPCDDRLYDAPNDGETKNDHVRAMLKTAQQRGLTPRYVCFDGWYSALGNLKLIRTLGWQWLTRLNPNRLVNPDGSGNRPLTECVIREAGTRVHLKGYGFILVFRIATPDGDTEYWATSDEWMTMAERSTTKLSRRLEGPDRDICRQATTAHGEPPRISADVARGIVAAPQAPGALRQSSQAPEPQLG